MPLVLPPVAPTGALARRARVVSERSWARWHSETRPYSVGVEDEAMLLHAGTHALAHRADATLAGLSDALRVRASLETHACVIELRTGVHATVPGALGELLRLRSTLAWELAGMGLRPAAAGTHPLASADDGQHSRSARYELVAETMRSLAHREPTMALHVHIGVPRPEDAIRVLNRLRENIPILIALSANSPFANGRDAGFASARTNIFGGFPRTGTPRPFRSYLDYVEAVDAVIASGAIPDPTFLWWDVRLQPRLGTVEVRAMDAASTLSDAAALVALVQSLVRLELEGEPLERSTGPEVLAENRFLAARDGADARLIDPAIRQLVPVDSTVARLVEDCHPHATELGCAAALRDVPRLLRDNGAARQRADGALQGIASVAPALADQFSSRGFPSC
jgi:glutamate---cysteine ligase / carboxylate-amine ligase